MAIEKDKQSFGKNAPFFYRMLAVPTNLIVEDFGCLYGRGEANGSHHKPW